MKTKQRNVESQLEFYNDELKNSYLKLKDSRKNVAFCVNHGGHIQFCTSGNGDSEYSTLYQTARKIVSEISSSSNKQIVYIRELGSNEEAIRWKENMKNRFGLTNKDRGFIVTSCTKTFVSEMRSAENFARFFKFDTSNCKQGIDNEFIWHEHFNPSNMPKTNKDGYIYLLIHEGHASVKVGSSNDIVGKRVMDLFGRQIPSEFLFTGVVLTTKNAADIFGLSDKLSLTKLEHEIRKIISGYVSTSKISNEWIKGTSIKNIKSKLDIYIKHV